MGNQQHFTPGHFRFLPRLTTIHNTMGAGGALLRFGLVGLRILQFGCAAVGLGIYSYFLAVLANHNYIIPTWEKAVEGLVGAATLYTIFGIILGLCLAGNKFFG